MELGTLRLPVRRLIGVLSTRPSVPICRSVALFLFTTLVRPKKIAVFRAPWLKKVGSVGRQQLFFFFFFFYFSYQKSVVASRILVIFGCRLLIFKQQ